MSQKKQQLGLELAAIVMSSGKNVLDQNVKDLTKKLKIVFNENYTEYEVEEVLHELQTKAIETEEIKELQEQPEQYYEGY